MATEHIVAQGECLSSIAAHYGLSSYKLIYDDPANAAFKKKHPNPNLIYPGDVLLIPDRKQKSVSCSTGKLHKFVVDRPKTVLRLQVQVTEPHSYELVVGDERFTGKTDGKSDIEHPIPAAAASAHIELWPTRQERAGEKLGLISWDLQLGHLDPFDTISGVQARLANLGYFLGDVDGQNSDDLGLAVARFEAEAGLDVTGDPENATMQQKLCDLHDGG